MGQRGLTMSEHFDVVVVGTGFGGAAVACRLAQGGARVLVLERGRRWTREEYPRTPGDAWLYHPAHPQKLNGWLDLRFFRGMIVAQGAGVGGGSQCYSSVLMARRRQPLRRRLAAGDHGRRAGPALRQRQADARASCRSPRAR